MQTPTRRAFLRGSSALVAAAALTACKSTTTGNVTTITINVAEIKDYGQAGLNAATTVLSIAAVASAIGTPAVGIIGLADTALSTALTDFSTAAGSTLTITYDDTNWKTRVDSILSALTKVESDLSAAITGVSTKVLSTDLSDVSAFKALLDSVATRRNVGARLSGSAAAPSQAQVQPALQVLGVTA
ncbi:twin-arginine translocation signal domain-containing protein [Komagataeibacter oboediens]|uniref:twin-arginine translocation signal domain-containing protein n=1 Tax=Komagataeibacter oboediens TaxID=65958 RepID=UPI001C2CC2F2|nr:twin-arginine translocation signal domain-containing protein [Komagataeibacter oboediens]MBV0889988.1 twin-arginine translocation signal domain-containing protein [Komagataeibacter oboediens]MCK9821774.1 twin-arginine translocation signal domain-containing protein [Komagataeibacter oboediens]